MSGTRVYVGHLSSRTRERDIEEAFSAYGRINRVDLKFGYGFVDFDDSRDAEDAVREMDGRNVDGERIIVEFARGDRRDDRSRRNPPPTEGRCFNCGKDGHWARDCPDEEGRDLCFNCKRPGHLARECKERKGSGGGGRVSSRSHPYSRDDRRSYSRSRSRSPRRRRSRSPRRRSRSPRRRSRSPRRSSVSPRSRSHSPIPRHNTNSANNNDHHKNNDVDENNENEETRGQKHSPIVHENEANKSASRSPSPQKRSRSPSPEKRSPSPDARRRSASPLDDDQ